MTSNGFLLNSKRCNIKISAVSSAWKPGAKRRGFIVSYWSYTSQGVYNRCLYISLLRVTRAAFSPMQVLLMCQDIISFSILIVGVSSQSDSVTFVTVNIDHYPELYAIRTNTGKHLFRDKHSYQILSGLDDSSTRKALQRYYQKHYEGKEFPSILSLIHISEPTRPY